MNPYDYICPDCGAVGKLPSLRDAKHVKGCEPNAAWEVRSKVNGEWGEWVPAPPQDAAAHRDSRNVEIRRVQED